MSELLKKYESLDQSKLNEGTIKILNRVKTITADFTADDAKNNKIAEDVLNEVMKKNPNAVKIVKRTPKAKTAPKKTHKATHTTKGAHTTSSTAKTSNNIMSVTKEIQKAGESWKDAMERAKAVIKERKEKVVQKQKTELEKLYNLVKTKKELQGFANSDIRRDSVREAKVRGARFVTKEGNTSNKYGTFPNKLGRKYWETRDRHADRLAPNYPKDMPLLASGGMLPKDVLKEIYDAQEKSVKGGFFPEYDSKYKYSLLVFGNYYAISIENKSSKEFSAHNYFYDANYKFLGGADSINAKSKIEENKLTKSDFTGTKFVPYKWEDGGMMNNMSIHNSTDFFNTPVYANGGSTQGYDDKEDERLAMKYGKIANKDLDSTHSRRDDARFEERGKMANGGSVNMNKHIWEGWTVGSFIEELEPQFNQIMSGGSWQKPFKTKEEVKAWCMDNQPYYKKNIPEVVNYFWAKVQSKDNYADGGMFEEPIGMMREVKGKTLNVPVTDEISQSEINRFVDYVYEAYESYEQDGVYEFTKPQVRKAVKKYLAQLQFEHTWGGGDSLDRERVYEFLINPNLEEIKNPRFLDGGMNNLTIQNVSFADGGSVSNLIRMYNFLKDDLVQLEEAIKSGDFEEVNRFFSYWLGSSGHLSSLKTMNNQRMYMFLQEDLFKLRLAVENNDTEEVERFFSYWLGSSGHLVSIIGSDIVPLVQNETAKIWEKNNPTLTAGVPPENFEKNWKKTQEEAIQKLKNEGKLPEDLKFEDIGFMNKNYEKGGIFYKEGSNKYGLGNTEIFVQEENDMYCVYDNVYNDESENWEIKKLADFDTMDEAKEFAIEHSKKEYANGGSLPFMTDPNFGNFQNTGAFELGGAFMTTDLAGHTGGGTGGLNADMPLSGVSGTYYTGLVGETGAMSSGELFAKGGAVGDNVLGLKKGDIYKVIDTQHTAGSDVYTFIDYVDKDNNIMLKSIPFPPNPKKKNDFVYVYEVSSDGIKVLNDEEIGQVISRKYKNFVQNNYEVGGALHSEHTDNPLKYLSLMGAKTYGDLNYSTSKNGIDYHIGRKKDKNGDNKAIVVAFITDENNYMIDKEDAKEMSETAKEKGVDKVELYTNYGVELRSSQKPQILGFDKIVKVSGNYEAGGVMAQNQQVINDASQSYVNYYLNDGGGVFKDGGSIPNNYEGRTPEDVWNKLTIEQREHFLHDHIYEINRFDLKKQKKLTLADIEKAESSDWLMLDFAIKETFKTHIRMGQYAKGGAIKNQYQGRTPEDIWDSFTDMQRSNFLEDHKDIIKSSFESHPKHYLSDGDLISQWRLKYRELNPFVKLRFDDHVNYGQYAYGGKTKSRPSMRKLYIEQIAFATNTRTEGVDAFAKEHNLTDSELSNLMTGLGRKIISQSDFITALVGNKNNPKQKEVVAFAKSDKAYKMADGGFTPDVSDGTQFMSGVYANGGSVGDVSGNYYSSTDFVSQNDLIDLAKSTFGQDWESGGDYDYDTEEIKMLVKKLGGGYKIVYVDSEQREKFENAKSKYLPLLKNKSNDGDIFVIPNKKMSDGGFTPDVSDGTQFMSGVYANGGGIRSKEELKKIFSEKEAIVKNLTPKQIAEMWNKNSFGVKEGISKPITIEEAKRPSMKIYLENLLIENELTEEEQAKYFAKGGFVGNVEFNVGDTVWQKDEKRYATVMNNYGDPINGSGGDIRLDTSGNTNIFTYDKKYNNTGYNLVKVGEKGDTGKFTPEVLAEMKESANRLIDSNGGRKDPSDVAYYKGIYKRLLDGEFDSMVSGAKPTNSNKKGSSDYTYVPNKDVKELSVVVKGELKKLMGSDILDGVYVKNSAKSTAKVDVNAVFAKMLKDGKEAKSGKTKMFTATDLKKLNLEMVQKLVEAGYTEQQIRNIIFGYAFDNEIVADNELEYDKGIFSYEDTYVKSKIEGLVEAQKNKEFAVGIEYPDFDWQGIIKKYKISSKPKDITEKQQGTSGSTENYYEVFVGDNIVIGHNYGYKWLDADGKVLSNYMEEDKKVSDPTKQNAWQKERGQKAGFNGGWWTIISSKIEIIDDVLKTLLAQKGSYCKEIQFYDDSLPKTLKENKIDFADGGELNKDNVKVGDVLVANTGVEVKVVEFDPKFGGRIRAVRLDEYATGKASQFMPLNKFTRKTNSKMADGGELTNLKKGDRVLLKDGSTTKGATVTQDGLDSQKRVRVRPDGFPFDISVTLEENNKTYVIKKLMSGGSYADGGFMNNVYSHGGKMEVNDINSELEDFDLDNLDPFETMQYENYSKSMSKVDALQVLINTVEGDYSQLSPELAELAEMQISQEQWDESSREMYGYAKGGSLDGVEKNEIRTFVNSLFNQAKNKISNDKGLSLFVISNTVNATKDSLGNPSFYLGVKKVQNSRPTYVVGSGFLSSDMLVYESYKKDSRFLETESIVEAKKFLTEKVQKLILHLKSRNVLADGGKIKEELFPYAVGNDFTKENSFEISPNDVEKYESMGFHIEFVPRETINRLKRIQLADEKKLIKSKINDEIRRNDKRTDIQKTKDEIKELGLSFSNEIKKYKSLDWHYTIINNVNGEVCGYEVDNETNIAYPINEQSKEFLVSNNLLGKSSNESSFADGGFMNDVYKFGGNIDDLPKNWQYKVEQSGNKPNDNYFSEVLYNGERLFLELGEMGNTREDAKKEVKDFFATVKPLSIEEMEHSWGRNYYVHFKSKRGLGKKLVYTKAEAKDFFDALKDLSGKKNLIGLSKFSVRKYGYSDSGRFYVIDENDNTINKKTGKVYNGKQTLEYVFQNKNDAQYFADKLNEESKKEDFDYYSFFYDQNSKQVKIQQGFVKDAILNGSKRDCEIAKKSYSKLKYKIGDTLETKSEGKANVVNLKMEIWANKEGYVSEYFVVYENYFRTNGGEKYKVTGVERIGTDDVYESSENNQFADGGFMNDVYAKGGEVKDKDGFNLYDKLDNTIKKDFWVWEYKKPSDVIEDRSDSEDYEDGTEKAVVDYCIARMQRGYIHAFHIQGKNGDDFNFVSRTWQDAWDKYDNDDYADIDDEEDDDDDSYAKGGGVGFKPYGNTKGKFKITYIADGKKQSEIRETLEMAIDTAKRYKKYDEFSKIEVFDESGKKIMADGGMFDDNDGFMKADNNYNYRYPEMEVYVETIDEPIDLTSNVSSRSNKVVIVPIDENIDLNDDNRVRARMGFEPKNRTPEKMMMVNPRMIVNNLPTPMSNTHKND